MNTYTILSHDDGPLEPVAQPQLCENSGWCKFTHQCPLSCCHNK